MECPPPYWNRPGQLASNDPGWRHLKSFGELTTWKSRTVLARTANNNPKLIHLCIRERARSFGSAFSLVGTGLGQAPPLIPLIGVGSGRELIMRKELQKHLWPVGSSVDFEGRRNSALKRHRLGLGDYDDLWRFPNRRKGLSATRIDQPDLY
jgi:hypothetical protein